MNPAQRYESLPEGTTRCCSHCGSTARYIKSPESVEDALSTRERLCERCYRERVGAPTTPILSDPDVWNPPEGLPGVDEEELIPAIFMTPDEPDLPDLPHPDALDNLNDAEITHWVNILCTAEVVRTPGTRYAAGLPAASVRAELRSDLSNATVREAYQHYRDARRRAWERERTLPHYEGEHREPALRAEAVRLASEGYDARAIYLGLFQFDRERCHPPLFDAPAGPDDDIPELQEIANGTYESLPLSRLRVHPVPTVINADIGGGKIYRNDRKAKKILFVTQITDKEGGIREIPSLLSNVAIDEVIIRVSPRGSTTRYECRFVGSPRTVLTITGTLPEVAGRLIEEGVIVLQHQLLPALAAIIQEMRACQTCAQSDEEYLPGFYPARYRDVETWKIDLADGITAIDLHTPPLERERLRSALIELDRIVTRWHGYSDDATTRISTALKWGIVAPFGFIRKHIGIPSDHLILSGNSQTGKSITGQLVLSLWGRNSPGHRIQYGAFNSEARAGEQLARYTYPIVVDEMNLGNEALEELLKNVWESLISREPLTVTRQRQPRDALASIIMTTNAETPVGDGMRNRSAILTYDLSDRDWTLKNQADFQIEGMPGLDNLAAIGSYMAAVIQRTPDVLSVRSWTELGERALVGAYQYVGMDAPEWVYRTYDYTTDTTVEGRVSVALAFRDYIVRVFMQEFPKYRSLFNNERDWEEEFWDLPKRLDLLLAVGALPPVHPVRKKGPRAPSGVREAIKTVDEIEAVRIDAGLFHVPEVANTPEVKKNLHGSLENLARILGVDHPRYQNLSIKGKRSKRLAITVPKSLLITLIETVTGTSDES